MRWVQVEDGLSLRFPARDAAFHEGVELGILAALLNAGHGRVTHILSAANLNQARALATKMGYRLSISGPGRRARGSGSCPRAARRAGAPSPDCSPRSGQRRSSTAAKASATTAIKAMKP